MACSQASGTRAQGLEEGKEKRLTAVYASHGPVPFREPAARSESLQHPGKPLARGRLWQGCEGLSTSAQSETPLMGNPYAGARHQTG